MSKTLIVALLALIFCKEAYAQKGHHERIKAYKTAYITEELDLTSAEAEKFWPIYNEYHDKIFNSKILLVKKERRRINELGGPESLSDEDASKSLSTMMDYEDEAMKTRKKMYGELSGVLSPVKLLKLHLAEMNFGKKLLSDYRKRRAQEE